MVHKLHFKVKRFVKANIIIFLRVFDVMNANQVAYPATSSKPTRKCMLSTTRRLKKPIFRVFNYLILKLKYESILLRASLCFHHTLAGTNSHAHHQMENGSLIEEIKYHNN